MAKVEMKLVGVRVAANKANRVKAKLAREGKSLKQLVEECLDDYLARK